MITFSDCGNYRGCLQAKEEGGKYFWRVDCDVQYMAWVEIPAGLYSELMKFHAEGTETRSAFPVELAEDPDA